MMKAIVRAQACLRKTGVTTNIKHFHRLITCIILRLHTHILRLVLFERWFSFKSQHRIGTSDLERGLEAPCWSYFQTHFSDLQVIFIVSSLTFLKWMNKKVARSKFVRKKVLWFFLRLIMYTYLIIYTRFVTISYWVNLKWIVNVVMI